MSLGPVAVSYKLASDVKFLSYFNTVLLLFLIHYGYVHYDDHVLFQIPPFPMVKSCQVECKNLQFVDSLFVKSFIFALCFSQLMIGARCSETFLNSRRFVQAWI